MTLEQLFNTLNNQTYVSLYDLDNNFLHFAKIKNCDKIYLHCGVETIEIGKQSLVITLQIKDGHF